MKGEPLFLRPTSSAFWIMMACSAGVTLVVLVLWGLTVGPDPTRLWLGAAGIVLIGLAGTYLLDGALRWWRLNFRYARPRDMDD